MQTVKTIGFDFELSNSLQTVGAHDGRAHEAARRLLQMLPGYPDVGMRGSSIEFGRRFLETCGSSWYIDSDHLEGNLPEHRNAFDFPTILHGAGFAEARRAKWAAEADLPPDVQLNVLANCSDGNTSWGSHLSMMMWRPTFQDMLNRKPHLAALLATHLVTSTLYTGQGSAGPANGRPWCDFQLSQRADWFEQFSGQQTMFDRPLINLREEHHAGAQLARLHIIYYDMVLSPVANILKVGTTQLLLSMIESGWFDPTLTLDDAVQAASSVSRDLKLRQRYRTLARGQLRTALEIQQGLADLAGEFVSEGRADPYVPEAAQLVTLWHETLQMLKDRDIEALSRRCDNWLKYLLLDRQRKQHNINWSSGDLKVLDLQFANLDTYDSLFFRMVEAGHIEAMPDEAEIERARTEPPEDTRAYLRAHVLRRFGHAVSRMNWDRIDFRVPDGRHWWSVATLDMPDPCGYGKAEAQSVLACDNLSQLVELAAQANPPVQPSGIIDDSHFDLS